MRFRILPLLAYALGLSAAAASASTRSVFVGQGGTKFVDAVSGTSTSNIYVGDTIQWSWSAGFHSSTSGTCPTTCSPDGTWDSGQHSAPHLFSHTFPATGTFTYYCSVHGAMMQGTVIVTVAPPPPTPSSVTPTSGPADTGDAFTITGTDFTDGATVTVGGAAATGVTFQDATTINATTPVLSPGTLNDVVVTNPDMQAGTLTKGWMADFLDVPQADIFHGDVEKVFRNGITAGCANGNYCRNDPVTRAQMAVFLLKAKYGSGYVPPACTGMVFTDVPCTGGPFDPWIEDLAAQQITGGCGNNMYCPGSSVTRKQMAVFLLKAHDGSSYTPPTCAGVFADVACPSLFADWIEELYNRQITGGCSASPLNYCPDNPNNRGQMAVFLSKTFSLP